MPAAPGFSQRSPQHQQNWPVRVAPCTTHQSAKNAFFATHDAPYFMVGSLITDSEPPWLKRSCIEVGIFIRLLSLSTLIWCAKRLELPMNLLLLDIGRPSFDFFYPPVMPRAWVCQRETRYLCVISRFEHDDGPLSGSYSVRNV